MTRSILILVSLVLMVLSLSLAYKSLRRPCQTCPSCDAGVAPTASDGGAGGATTLELANQTKAATVAYLAFGADSVIQAANLKPLCTVDSTLNAHCALAAGVTLPLPLSGQYTNVTVSFGKAVSCGTTKGEVNLNNQNWYNIIDVSLVDGFSNEIQITYQAATKTVIGPTMRADGNENMPGVFPLHCDICVARQKPTCGSTPGRDGCKAGTQYDPHPPCQWQAPTRNDGASVTVALVDLQPA